MPITTKAVSLNPAHSEVYSMQHYVIRFVSDLQQVSGFILELSFSSTGKTDRHDITEILLKMAFFCQRNLWLNVMDEIIEYQQERCSHKLRGWRSKLWSIVWHDCSNTSTSNYTTYNYHQSAFNSDCRDILYFIWTIGPVKKYWLPDRTIFYLNRPDILNLMNWSFWYDWRYELVSAYLAFPTASLV